MDRDNSGGQGWFRILGLMKKGEIDILIGTQMITKGHDFANLTLVGILDADVALHLPDFRASERLFQLITQVSGRAGRSDKQGEVLVQTYHPDHSSIVSASNYDGKNFYLRELGQRLEAGYPPYKRLIQIRLAGKRKDLVAHAIKQLSQRLREKLPPASATTLGPAPCPIERVRGLSRWHLMIKTSAYTKIQPSLRTLLDQFTENDLPSGFRMLVNVDPVDMM